MNQDEQLHEIIMALHRLAGRLYVAAMTVQEIRMKLQKITKTTNTNGNNKQR